MELGQREKTRRILDPVLDKSKEHEDRILKTCFKPVRKVVDDLLDNNPRIDSIIVLFSGTGSVPLVISERNPQTKVLGLSKSKKAHKQAQETRKTFAKELKRGDNEIPNFGRVKEFSKDNESLNRWYATTDAVIVAQNDLTEKDLMDVYGVFSRLKVGAKVLSFRGLSLKIDDSKSFLPLIQGNEVGKEGCNLQVFLYQVAKPELSGEIEGDLDLSSSSESEQDQDTEDEEDEDEEDEDEEEEEEEDEEEEEEEEEENVKNLNVTKLVGETETLSTILSVPFEIKENIMRYIKSIPEDNAGERQKIALDVAKAKEEPMYKLEQIVSLLGESILLPDSKSLEILPSVYYSQGRRQAILVDSLNEKTRKMEKELHYEYLTYHENTYPEFYSVHIWKDEQRKNGIFKVFSGETDFYVTNLNVDPYVVAMSKDFKFEEGSSLSTDSSRSFALLESFKSRIASITPDLMLVWDLPSKIVQFTKEYGLKRIVEKKRGKDNFFGNPQWKKDGYIAEPSGTVLQKTIDLCYLVNTIITFYTGNRFVLNPAFQTEVETKKGYALSEDSDEEELVQGINQKISLGSKGKSSIVVTNRNYLRPKSKAIVSRGANGATLTTFGDRHVTDRTYWNEIARPSVAMVAKKYDESDEESLGSENSEHEDTDEEMEEDEENSDSESLHGTDSEDEEEDESEEDSASDEEKYARRKRTKEDDYDLYDPFIDDSEFYEKVDENEEENDKKIEDNSTTVIAKKIRNSKELLDSRFTLWYNNEYDENLEKYFFAPISLLQNQVPDTHTNDITVVWDAVDTFTGLKYDLANFSIPILQFVEGKWNLKGREPVVNIKSGLLSEGMSIEETTGIKNVPLSIYQRLILSANAFAKEKDNVMGDEEAKNNYQIEEGVVVHSHNSLEEKLGMITYFVVRTEYSYVSGNTLSNIYVKITYNNQDLYQKLLVYDYKKGYVWFNLPRKSVGKRIAAKLHQIVNKFLYTIHRDFSLALKNHFGDDITSKFREWTLLVSDTEMTVDLGFHPEIRKIALKVDLTKKKNAVVLKKAIGVFDDGVLEDIIQSFTPKRAKTENHIDERSYHIFTHPKLRYSASLALHPIEDFVVKSKTKANSAAKLTDDKTYELILNVSGEDDGNTSHSIAKLSTAGIVSVGDFFSINWNDKMDRLLPDCLSALLGCLQTAKQPFNKTLSDYSVIVNMETGDNSNMASVNVRINSGEGFKNSRLRWFKISTFPNKVVTPLDKVLDKFENHESLSSSELSMLPPEMQMETLDESYQAKSLEKYAPKKGEGPPVKQTRPKKAVTAQSVVSTTKKKQSKKSVQRLLNERPDIMSDEDSDEQKVPGKRSDNSGSTSKKAPKRLRGDVLSDDSESFSPPSKKRRIIGIDDGGVVDLTEVFNVPTSDDDDGVLSPINANIFTSVTDKAKEIMNKSKEKTQKVVDSATEKFKKLTQRKTAEHNQEIQRKLSN